MSDEIPQWAKERAIELAHAEGSGIYTCFYDDPFGRYQDGSGARNQALYALAKHIAAHEEPPVDPLLIEARKLAGDIAMERGANRDVVDHYETAKATDPEISRVIRALRRGIELGKSDA
jgi:hypothetical protein